MIICVPLSYFMRLITNKYLFLAINVTLTITFQSILFPNEKHFLWIQQQIVYLIIYFCPRKLAGHVVFVESFVFLAYIQIRRISISYG